MSGEALDALERLRENYKAARPRQASAIDAAMEKLNEDSGSVGSPGEEKRAEADPEQVFVVRCDRCGEGIAEYRKAWQKVEGWERHRSAGGTNALALRTPMQVFMCEPCMIKEKRGIPQQETLL